MPPTEPGEHEQREACEMMHPGYTHEQSLGFDVLCTRVAAALRAREATIAMLQNDLADALDLKNGCGPTVLTALAKERDALRADVERLTQDYKMLKLEAVAARNTLIVRAERAETAAARAQEALRMLIDAVETNADFESARERLMIAAARKAARTFDAARILDPADTGILAEIRGVSGALDEAGREIEGEAAEAECCDCNVRGDVATLDDHSAATGHAYTGGWPTKPRESGEREGRE